MARTKTVLIVDDEPGMTRALAAVLEDAGFRVEAAGNGVAALQHLAKNEAPDVVLLDFLMPGKDGCDTLREIRDDAQLEGLPVVMMSGVVESMIKRRCRDRRYDAFLRKPFVLDELLEAVNGAIRSGSSRRSRR